MIALLPSLSPAASDLVAEIGDSMSDSLSLAAELDRFIERDHREIYCPVSIAKEVRAHFIRKIGPLLREILPFYIGGFHHSQETWCEGCPQHGSSPDARDGWKIEASPSAASTEQVQTQIHAAFHAA